MSGHADMREMALRGRIRAVGGKDADPVRHARISNARHEQADIDVLGIGKRGAVRATGFDDQPDRVAALNVEEALLDQPIVHRRIEPLIVDRVVDVPICVIVRPSCLEAHPPVIGGSRKGGQAAHKALS